MAFNDKDNEPTGKFFIDKDGQVISCLNGTNVRCEIRLSSFNAKNMQGLNWLSFFFVECSHPLDEWWQIMGYAKLDATVWFCGLRSL